MEKNSFLLIDGGLGTLLQERGLRAGDLPETMNFTAPDVVRKIHGEYIAAGADVITANTFGANRRKLGSTEKVRETISAAVRLVREAGAKKAALDIGPTGALLEPFGPLPFEEAYRLFQEEVEAGVAAGADMILIETMTDLLEAKAALLAAKEHSGLPVFVTLSFGSDGRTFLGTDPKTAAVTLSALGADAVGINCSTGPTEMLPLAREMLDWAKVPVIVQPNAGLPECVGDKTVYNVGVEEFTEAMGKMLSMGVTIVGGCCGTTPAYTRALRAELDRRTPVGREMPRYTAFSSAQRTVAADGAVVVIGERINPTGKKRLKEALRSGDMDYVQHEAIAQTEAGADVLDVNAGLPELDEAETLGKMVTAIQAVSPLPLQIDSSDPVAVERAVRRCAGKPIINSVNGKEESLAAILPIAKKYGAAVVGLTLDERGIPETAAERLEIAEKIVARAEQLGIPREDVLIDCLVMTVSANQSLAMETLKAVSLVREKLGCRTVLGVSNISFGLPAREIVNASFLAAALGAGLDLPILNPLSSRYMEVVAAMQVLRGSDKNAERFIASFAPADKKPLPASQPEQKADITRLVLSGQKTEMERAVLACLESESPMDVINNRLIPAINAAGDRFDRGEFFLPQLMASADAVKAGFDTVKARAESGDITAKGTVLLATVKDDIHDIGKNIVKMLLSNYGYEVVDLGRDVPPERVVEETLKRNIRLVGLSALMTTTVKSMEATILALHASGADCRIMVGGAVLNEEYAKMVGADFYAKDAAEAARIAERVLG